MVLIVLLEIASKDIPFDITLLTVDIHYTDGYTCDLCRYEYDDQFSNVVRCADDQVWNFIEWCKTQDWSGSLPVWT